VEAKLNAKGSRPHYPQQTQDSDKDWFLGCAI